MASTTPVRGAAPAGLTTLPDGTLLLDAVRKDPIAWLGAGHVARWGADSMILVKLLDAGQRLPVHAHPDDAFAATELASAHGKAEAWFILEPGDVYLGLRADIDRAGLARLVRTQDTTTLLRLLNKVAVAKNDSVTVPPGTLHAIGKSVLLAEVQQPSDLSILLEWEGFAVDGAAEGHLGLGFDRALEAVNIQATAPRQIGDLVRRAALEGPALPTFTKAWFRLDRTTSSAGYGPGFAIIIATEGSSRLISTAGTLNMAKGTTAVVPAATGPITVKTDGAALIARPPAA
ncbi:class I mannose-6-phosphate isomerase [Arthrobacter sp. SDTb3-6]|uniref:class I mannose-6-phosphate isomerase n=1 Tax=Arthrobacter sp. SDTb3-6 TaxID=2713571 RepID=UPI0035234B52